MKARKETKIDVSREGLHAMLDRVIDNDSPPGFEGYVCVAQTLLFVDRSLTEHSRPRKPARRARR